MSRFSILQEADPIVFVSRFFEILVQGEMPVPVSPLLSEFEKENLKQAFKSLTPISDAYACLTSGTTSTPKLCFLSTKGATENAKAHAESLGITSEMQIIQCLPLHHSFGVVAYLFAPRVIGCEIQYASSLLGLRGLAKLNPKNAIIHISPAQVRLWLKEKVTSDLMRDLRGIKKISVGGALVDSDELAKLQTIFSDSEIYVTYGLTEAGPRVTTGRVWGREPHGFIGSALPGVFLRVLSDKGFLSEYGEGRLCVHSPSLKLHINSEEYVRDTLTGLPFLTTRDRVDIRPDGNVCFLSREEDIIKVGGVSIYPRDIERLVRTNQQIKDCIVLPVLDSLYGETPVLAVESSTSEKELQTQVFDFLKEKLTPVEMPRKILVFKEFPRQSLNKIDRKALLNKMNAGAP